MLSRRALQTSASAVVLGSNDNSVFSSLGRAGGNHDDLQYWSFAVKRLEQRNRDLQAENTSLHAQLQRALVKTEEYEKIIAYLSRHERHEHRDDSKPIEVSKAQQQFSKGCATADDDAQQYPSGPTQSRARRATIEAHNAAVAADELRFRGAIPPVPASARGKVTRVAFDTRATADVAPRVAEIAASAPGPHDGAADGALRLPSISHRDASIAAVGGSKLLDGYVRRYSDAHAHRAAEERTAQAEEAAADGGPRGMKRSSHGSNPTGSPAGGGGSSGGAGGRPSRSRGFRVLKDAMIDFAVGARWSDSMTWARHVTCARHAGSALTSEQLTSAYSC